MKDIVVGEAVVTGDRAVVPFIKEIELSGAGGILYSARPVALIVAETGSTLLFRLDTGVSLSEETIHKGVEQASDALKRE
ncbi:hypothetical protein RJ40_07540 [Methanofollis aquaemaris]|uniref:Uncharacterized protein n=1 Tax=Methanofollis aquaemaris TaxID=126734 RepID=A0A8A3S6T4_9EURY|nr:hypothetical protein [Methanofollis aquaemaris]QSZ67364.1 hypothetical protein RJ40_07540 [Methanofollis aquaemaris]